MTPQVLWTSSSTLLRETVFEGYLVNIEPLRIGASREAPPLGSIVDLAILEINYKGHTIPYIPGSSLKGVFRSWATTIARSKGLNVCTGLSKETCMDIREVDGKKLRAHIHSKLKGGNSSAAMKIFWDTACLMCKIFGAPGYSSKVHFSDAYPIDENGNPTPTLKGVRTGIAINRRTGAVFRGALYTVEYVEPGARFKFNVRCENLPNYALGLLSSILKMIDSGEIKIGGFKTRGFGACRVENLKVLNRDLNSEGTTLMKALDEKDKPVNLEELVKTSNGWLIAEGRNAWKVLRRLEEVWENYKL